MSVFYFNMITKTKKIIFLSFLLLPVVFILPVNSLYAITGLEGKVVIYNWSEYIPEGVLESFTKETGIEVEYSTYDNNEVMYARLKALKGRGYDVIVPSTHILKKMAEDGLIQKIDHEKLENFSNLDKSLLNKPYDPGNNYSIPYMWGSTGIALDREKYKDMEVTNWSDLLGPRWQNKLLMIDDMRDVFAVGLKANGLSINTRDEDQINLAYSYLEKLSKNVKLYSGSSKEDFLSKNASIGMIWNGDVIVVQKEIPSMEYIYPKEGVSFWADNFAIPSHAKNVLNAHKFIDYMLRPDIAALCTTELGYATPNKVGKSLLPENIQENKIIFPTLEVINASEFQEDVGGATEIYKVYWSKLKTVEK